jgi:hypothetical protein
MDGTAANVYDSWEMERDGVRGVPPERHDPYFAGYE